MRQVIIDTETTGLRVSENHRIIEIGAVEMIDRKLTGNNFHCLINPQQQMTVENINIHHITNEQLIGKPLFKDVAEDLINFIRDSEIIIHNAVFDIGFLNAELDRIRGLGKIEDYINNYIDTLAIAKQIRPGQQNNLDALCKHFGISLDERVEKGHGAVLDSQLTAQVYIYLTTSQTGFEFQALSTRPDEDLTIGHSPDYLKRLKVVPASAEELAEHNKVLDDIEEEQKTETIWRKLNNSNITKIH